MTDITLPTLSVIVPTYNERDRLADAIKSLSQQKYPIDLVEILVIEDGSPEPINEKSLVQYAIPFKLFGLQPTILYSLSNAVYVREQYNNIYSTFC